MDLEILTLIPFLVGGFDPFGAFKKAISAPFKAATKIPGIGDILEEVGPALGPLASFIPGVGPIAAPLLGALGGGASGGIGGALGGALAGLSANEIRQLLEQQQKDAERARELTNQAVGIGTEQFQKDAPLRESFRTGALTFQDPTNPFTSVISGAQPRSPIENVAQQAGGRGGFGGFIGGALQNALSGGQLVAPGGGGGSPIINVLGGSAGGGGGPGRPAPGGADSPIQSVASQLPAFGGGRARFNVV